MSDRPPLMSIASPYDLKSKRVLVTGASSGIGREVAKRCAAMGAVMVITGRDKSRLADTQAALTEGDHQVIPADLTDVGLIRTFVARVGGIDGIVHCAGIHGVMPVRMVSKDFVDKVLNTNFLAPVLLTQQFLAQKFLKDNASVLFMASIAAHTGTVGVATYSASKSATLGFMRPLALEVAKRGIRVNALSPGLIDTPLVNTDRVWLEEKAKPYPLGLGQPSDVANAAVFLLSDASRKITGSIFHIDGGIPFT